MRYSIFLPQSKGGYKVGTADDLVEAFCLRDQQNRIHNISCIIYDSKLKTTDVQAMIMDKFEEDHFLRW
ncbi:MAG: hypothetical protein Q4E74_11830 [Ruminococcus sp.]|nr:hypothetical protein [Ruminococcus sp.]MDO4945874.1 hypothetical protein [Ruminococcus sp.]